MHPEKRNYSLEKIYSETCREIFPLTYCVARDLPSRGGGYATCLLIFILSNFLNRNFYARFSGEDEKAIDFIAGITRSSRGGLSSDCKNAGNIPFVFFFFIFPSLSRVGSWENKAEYDDQHGYNERRVSFEESRSRVPIRGLLTPRWMADEMGRDWVWSRVMVSQGSEMENHESSWITRLFRRLEPFILNVTHARCLRILLE